MEWGDFDEDKCMSLKCPHLGCMSGRWSCGKRITDDSDINRFLGKIGKPLVLRKPVTIDCPFELEHLLLKKKDLPDWEAIGKEILGKDDDG